jgi:uncharacterized protein YjbJ (UPF0337 family)
MQWNELETKWNQNRGLIQNKWNKLTDNDLQSINGKKEQLLAKLQECYGLSRNQAEKDLDAFLKSTTETHMHAGGGL